MTEIKGFVRIGFRSTFISLEEDSQELKSEKGGIFFTPYSQMFLNITYNEKTKHYSFKGVTLFYESNIPKKYREHEFAELYDHNEHSEMALKQLSERVENWSVVA